MRSWWGAWGGGLGALALALAPGCGGSKFDGTTIVVEVFSSGAGLTSPYAFFAAVTDAAGNCPLSSSATLAINSQEVSFVSCVGTSAAFGANPPFTLRATDGADVAEMDVDDLAPGTNARLIPDAPIPSGAAFTISIPPELEGRSVGEAQFVNTIEGTSVGAPTTSDGHSVALQAPAQAGSYLVTMRTGDADGSPSVPGHVTTCAGFGRCAAIAGTLIGPVVMLVSPAPTP